MHLRQGMRTNGPVCKAAARLVALVAVTTAAACGSDETDHALAILRVVVSPEVPPFQSYRFSVVDRPDVPARQVAREPGQATFTFGYYLKGVSGKLTIRAQAIDAHACVVGQGTAAVSVTPGEVSATVSLMIAVAMPDPSCSVLPDGGPSDAADSGPGDAVDDGPSDATDGGLSDASDDPAGCEAAGTCKIGAGGECGRPSDCESGACIDGRCCTASACGSCQACTGAGGVCVAVSGKDDPDSCAGTCDASGVCRSKSGQSCRATPNGCLTGATCAPDGVCCDQACRDSCMACDLPGSEGKCTPVAAGKPRGNRPSCGSGPCEGTCSNGQCAYPSRRCGPGAACAGNQYTGPGMCDGGTCVTPATQTCAEHLVCDPNGCKTTCTNRNDCVDGYFCAATGGCVLAAVKVAAGLNSSHVVLRDGSVRGWGANFAGQRGDGTYDSSEVPVNVPGLLGPTAISEGKEHACAIMSDRSLRCWGANFAGQLGNGGIDSSTVPKPVPSLSQVIAVAASHDQHTCAIVSGGRVSCWGLNALGQLGNGSTTDSAVPVEVSYLGAATAIATGHSHSCALLDHGVPFCWGGNAYGQLGNGSTEDALTPREVLVRNVVALLAGDSHTCALVEGGWVWCWGLNTSGQLGSPPADSSPRPLEVAGLRDVTAIAAGRQHTCALLAAGSVSCWGSNTLGQLGNNSAAGSSHTPVAVALPAQPAAAAIAANGGDHTCALLADGSLRCWGGNGHGQLGDGSRADARVPVAVRPW